MAFTEDLDAFLDSTYGHAVSATYNGSTAVKVIHDKAYLDALGVAGNNPVAVGKASDFAIPTAIGKTLLIGSTTYTIRNVRPLDDGAFVALELTDG